MDRANAAAYAAIYRCTNREDRRYGGRGIAVYPPWLKDPATFAAYLRTLEGWDNAGLMLDRINVDGNYEPNNLRYVTPKVSANNRRSKARVEIDNLLFRILNVDSRRLKALRCVHKLTLLDIAEASGTSMRDVLNLEAGKLHYIKFRDLLSLLDVYMTAFPSLRPEIEG